MDQGVGFFKDQGLRCRDLSSIQFRNHGSEFGLSADMKMYEEPPCWELSIHMSPEVLLDRTAAEEAYLALLNPSTLNPKP